MKLERQCIDCGNEFTAVVDDKTGHILIGRYYGKLRFENNRPYMGRWSQKFLIWDERTSIYQEASFWRKWLHNNFWWYSLPGQECTMSNQKKIFYMIYGWVKDKIKPPDMRELWVCQPCVTLE